MTFKDFVQAVQQHSPDVSLLDFHCITNQQYEAHEANQWDRVWRFDNGEWSYSADGLIGSGKTLEEAVYNRQQQQP